MDSQDWNPAIIKSSAPTNHMSKLSPKKSAVTPEAAAMRRLAVEEVARPKTLSAESRTQMMQLRAAMKKTQVELNQMCNFPANTLREIEAGRLVPSPSQLIRLNNVLRVKFALV